MKSVEYLQREQHNFRADKEVALAAVSQNTMALSFLAEELQRDDDVFTASLPFFLGGNWNFDFWGIYRRFNQPS